MSKSLTKAQIVEKCWFVQDDHPLESDEKKNDQLSKLLRLGWNKLSIVSITRKEIAQPGWEVLYRRVQGP